MMLKQNHYVVALLTFLLLVVSCEHANQEFVEQGCSALYKVNTVQIDILSHSIEISPELSFDRSFDKESRQFYNSIDTSLVFKGWINKRGSYAAHRDAGWSLIDWRLTGIDVKTLEDFDEKHPAGSLLNDVLEIEYFYKWSVLSAPLDSFQYGSLMLADYYPNRDDSSYTNGGLCLCLPDGDIRALPKCEVTIEDFFGNRFTIAREE